MKPSAKINIAGISSEVVDQITEAIIASIREAPGGVIELTQLMEEVNTRVSFQQNVNLVWAIIRVKKFLETSGVIRITFSADRVQLISFASANSTSVARSMISTSPVRMMVAFKLIHTKYSELEAQFVQNLQRVLTVGYVENFEFIRNNGKLNPYEFVVTCNFRNYAAFDKFLHYKPQLEFRKKHWDKHVADHMYFVYESQEFLSH